jgi:DNA-binding transcriptional MerR regulator
MATATVGFLSADVIAETGVSESYLNFLMRSDLIRPAKHRNGRSNVFSLDDIERVKWALDFRGRLSISEMRNAITRVRAA